MQTAGRLAKKITGGKGMYVIALKENQGTLYAAVTASIILRLENNFAEIRARCFTETLKGHDYVDEITYYQMPVRPILSTLKNNRVTNDRRRNS